MNPVLLILLFILSSAVGYVIIRNIPPLLHTPLMSGMNALSGITILGAMIAAGNAEGSVRKGLSLAACVLAMINAAGGFVLTDKMLRMFAGKNDGKKVAAGGNGSDPVGTAQNTEELTCEPERTDCGSGKKEARQ